MERRKLLQLLPFLIPSVQSSDGAILTLGSLAPNISENLSVVNPAQGRPRHPHRPSDRMLEAFAQARTTEGLQYLLKARLKDDYIEDVNWYTASVVASLAKNLERRVATAVDRLSLSARASNSDRERFYLGLQTLAHFEVRDLCASVPLSDALCQWTDDLMTLHIDTVLCKEKKRELGRIQNCRNTSPLSDELQLLLADYYESPA